MSSTAASNTFSSMFAQASNQTTGAKGANMLKSSGDLRLDAFLGLKRTSKPEYISSTINELVSQLNHLPLEQRGEWVADIWRIWLHKRHPRVGEKEKMLGRTMFIELYNHFPETCIMLVKANIFADMAYWKDVLLIWSDIHAIDMPARSLYEKYNPLIMAFRESFIAQRSSDLKALDGFLTPARIRDISKEDMVARLREPGAKIPQLSWVGKYCVRESSAENKRLFWWVQDTDGRLYRQSHVSFMLRSSLKCRVDHGTYEPWPVTKGVPFGAKVAWRKLNAKLDEALGVPEVKLTLNRIDEIDPTKLPGEFTKRNIKALLNEKVKKAPAPHEEETGNRLPDDAARVALRKRTRHMFADPSKMNVATLLPHIIAYDAFRAKSRAQTDYHIAAFEKKAQDVMADFEKVRAELAAAGEAVNDTDAVARAMATGNIVGVADVSGSMETTVGGAAPNRPIDIATGLVAFISKIAAEPYRDIAVSFTDIPTLFSFKIGHRAMNVKERMTELHRHVGYNTDYAAMHERLIELCVNNKVPESQLPVLYIASDCNFDQMDRSISCATSYNYSTGLYEGGGGSPTKKWETTHASIAKKWVAAGYNKVPLMVYHNINVGHSGVQEDQNFKGVILLTGRSEQVIKLILYGEAAEEVEQEVEIDGRKTKVKVNNVTPYDTFRKAMEGEHFTLLESVLVESQEGHLCNFKG